MSTNQAPPVATPTLNNLLRKPSSMAGSGQSSSPLPYATDQPMQQPPQVYQPPPTFSASQQSPVSNGGGNQSKSSSGGKRSRPASRDRYNATTVGGGTAAGGKHQEGSAGAPGAWTQQQPSTTSMQHSPVSPPTAYTGYPDQQQHAIPQQQQQHGMYPPQMPPGYWSQQQQQSTVRSPYPPPNSAQSQPPPPPHGYYMQQPPYPGYPSPHQQQQQHRFMDPSQVMMVRNQPPMMPMTNGPSSIVTDPSSSQWPRMNGPSKECLGNMAGGSIASPSGTSSTVGADEMMIDDKSGGINSPSWSSPHQHQQQQQHHPSMQHHSHGGQRTPIPPGAGMPPPPSSSSKAGTLPKDASLLDKLVGAQSPMNPPELMHSRRIFFQDLIHMCETRGDPLTAAPTVSKQVIDLYKLYYAVYTRNGFETVTREKTWKHLCPIVNKDMAESSAAGYQLRRHYQKYLLSLECSQTGRNYDELIAFAEKQKKSKKKKPTIEQHQSADSSFSSTVPGPSGQLSTPNATTAPPGYGTADPNYYGGQYGQPPPGSHHHDQQQPVSSGTAHHNRPPHAGWSAPPQPPPGYGQQHASGGTAVAGGQYAPPPQVRMPQHPGMRPPLHQQQPLTGIHQQQQLPPQSTTDAYPPRPPSSSSASQPGGSDLMVARDPFDDRNGQQSMMMAQTPTTSGYYSHQQQQQQQQPYGSMPGYAPSPTSASTALQTPDNRSRFDPLKGAVDPSRQQPPPPSTVAPSPSSATNIQSSSSLSAPTTVTHPSSSAMYYAQQQQQQQSMPPPPPPPSSSQPPPQNAMYGGAQRMSVKPPYQQQQPGAYQQQYPGYHPDQSSAPVNYQPTYQQQPQTGQPYPAPPQSQVMWAASQQRSGYTSATAPTVSQRLPPSVGGHSSDTPQHYRPYHHQGGISPVGTPSGQTPQQQRAYYGHTAVHHQQQPTPTGAVQRMRYQSTMTAPSPSTASAGYGGGYHLSTQPASIQQHQRQYLQAPSHQQQQSSHHMQQFPFGCVETTQPNHRKRRKIYGRDIPKIEPHRLLMALKCGLETETCWALNVLNVLLYDDASVGFFALNNLPGLLDAIVEHLRCALAQLYPQTFANEDSTTDGDNLTAPSIDEDKLAMMATTPCHAATVIPEGATSSKIPDFTKTTRTGRVVSTIGVPLPDVLTKNGRTDVMQQHPTIVITRARWEQGLGTNTTHLRCQRYTALMTDSNNNPKTALNDDDDDDDGAKKIKLEEHPLLYYRRPTANDLVLLTSTESRVHRPTALTSSSRLGCKREIIRRCLALSNVLRGLSFLAGNEAPMCRHPGLLYLIGRCLLLGHEHVPASTRRSPSDIQQPPRYDNDETDGDQLALYELSLQLRDDALVIVCHLSVQLDLIAHAESVVAPLVTGLLHWSVCRCADARDPTLVASAVVSPRNYALEALCKLSVIERNVDMVLAAGAWPTIERFVDVLANLLSLGEEIPYREFAIVLLNAITTTSQAACVVAASDTPAVHHLVAFLEMGDSNMHQIVQHQGMNALRENPELMGTSVGMLRRAASILQNFSRVPACRRKFARHQQRLLQFTMSQLMDSRVAAIIADTLFELQRDCDDNEMALAKKQQQQLAQSVDKKKITSVEIEETTTTVITTTTTTSIVKIEMDIDKVNHHDGAEIKNESTTIDDEDMKQSIVTDYSSASKDVVDDEPTRSSSSASSIRPTTSPVSTTDEFVATAKTCNSSSLLNNKTKPDSTTPVENGGNNTITAVVAS